MLHFVNPSLGEAKRSLGEGNRSPHEHNRSPGETEEELFNKNTEEEQKNKKDFLSQTKKPDRERIRDILVDVLADGIVPETDFLLKPYETAVDALVVEFRAMEGKTRLDHDLTSKIIGAIQSAYQEKGGSFPFKGATAPTRPVIGCIVEAGRKGKKRDAVNTTAGRAAKYASYPGVLS